MIHVKKLISSSKTHYVFFIYQNKYINKENLTLTILPTIDYTVITNKDTQALPLLNTKRYIITFSWLIFDITIDYFYHLNK